MSLMTIFVAGESDDELCSIDVILALLTMIVLVHFCLSDFISTFLTQKSGAKNSRCEKMSCASIAQSLEKRKLGLRPQTCAFLTLPSRRCATEFFQGDDVGT